MILFLHSLSYIYVLSMLSIQVCIICIVYDLGALGIAWKIQVIDYLQDWWVVHNLFMDLVNLYETIAHYLIIGGMNYFSHRDGFPMMNAQMCMVTHWTGPKINHDIIYRVDMIHQTIMLHELSTLREYWGSVEVFSGFNL